MNPRTMRKVTLIMPVVVVVSLCFTLAAAALADLADDTQANFSNGTVGSCLISPSAGDAGFDGEVVLGLGTGGMLETFSGASLPLDWTSGDYGGGSLTVSGDVLTLDRYYTGRSTLSSPPRTLDFVATFGPSRQHVGFGSDMSLNTGPWALFTTIDGDQLYARTHTPSTDTTTPLGATYLGTAHRYRIEWTTSSVVYYIDGTPVVTDTSPTIAIDMGPVASDVVVGTPLVVDWMRMGDYGTSCTFESRVLDGGQLDNDWTTLATTEYTPAGTTLTYETRSGNTPTPDVSWSDYQAVTGGNIASPISQYIQYSMTLTTADARFTPEVRRVIVHGLGPTAVTLSDLNAQADGSWNMPLLVVAMAAGLIVVGMVLKSRRQ